MFCALCSAEPTSTQIIAQCFRLPLCLPPPRSPTPLGQLLQVHKSPRKLSGVSCRPRRTCPATHLLMLSAHALSSCSPVYSPSDCEPFLTHRWESANQPHSVLALIQTLNWEEEQFHTPYLAWERKSETAWVLPGKTGCCGWAGWWKTYPEPGGRAWALVNSLLKRMTQGPCL